MPDSVGGFYASLKLNVDSASFNQGLAILKQFKNEINGIAQLQRTLNKLNERAAGGGGSTRGPAWKRQIKPLDLNPGLTKQKLREEQADRLREHKLKKLIMDNEIAGAKKGEDIMAKINKKKLEDQEAMATASKWWVGATVAAIAVMKKFGDALGDAFSRANVTTVNAKQLSTSGSRMTAIKNALDIALNQDTGDAAAQSMLNIQKRFAEPQWGDFNKDWATKLGVLAKRTGRSDLDWNNLKGMGNEERILKIMSAITQLSKKDMAVAVGLGDELLGKTVTAAATSGVFNAGVGAATTWVTDKDLEDMATMGREVMILSKNFQGLWDKFSAGFARDFIGFLDDLNTWMETNKNPISNGISNLINPLRTVDVLLHAQAITDAYVKANPSMAGKITNVNQIPVEFQDQWLKNEKMRGAAAMKAQLYQSFATMWREAAAADWRKAHGGLPTPNNWTPPGIDTIAGDAVVRNHPELSLLNNATAKEKAVIKIFVDNKLSKTQSVDIIMQNNSILGLNQ